MFLPRGRQFYGVAIDPATTKRHDLNQLAVEEYYVRAQRAGVRHTESPLASARNASLGFAVLGFAAEAC